MKVADLIAAVKEDSALDVTEPQVLRWLNVRHRQMCARSGCYRGRRSLGTLVAGQSSYPVPADVVQILEVDVGGTPYQQARHTDFALVEKSWAWLSGLGGVAGEDEAEDGVPAIRILPVPTTGVEGAITVYATLLPPDLSTTGDPNIKVPADYEDALAAGAIATALRRDEARVGEAQANEAIFAEGCQELRAATNRRFRGSGPLRVRMVALGRS